MQKNSFLNGVGVKWYEWWLVGQADDDYYCYYYWSLPFFASIPLPLYFTKIPKFSKLLKRTALCWPHIYSDLLQNAPFRSQIFKIFCASGGKGALTPPNHNPADLLRRSGLEQERISSCAHPPLSSCSSTVRLHWAPTLRSVRLRFPSWRDLDVSAETPPLNGKQRRSRFWQR